MYRFLALFIFLVLLMFWLELLAPVEQHVIVPFTSLIADVCGGLMRVLDSSVLVHGKVIGTVKSGWAISIERGCNGVEAMIILLSAIAAFPAPWKNKLLGVLFGMVAIQALNVVRIVSLFYLGQWNKHWFEWFHLYLWQALIVLDALVVFLFWLRSLPRPDAATAAVATPPEALA